MKIKKTRVLIGIICIVLAGVISLGGIPLAIRAMTKTVPVLIAKTDIKPGDQLTMGNCEIVNMAPVGLPEEVLSSIPKSDPNAKHDEKDKDKKEEEAKPVFSKKYISNKGFILKTSVTENSMNEESLLNIPANKLAISFTLEGTASAFDNQFLAGDIVRFMYLDKNEAGSNEEVQVPGVKTSKLLSYVKLLSVNNDFGIAVNEEDKKEVKYVVATVIVTPEQAAEIVRLEHSGGIHLSLVYRGNAQKASQYVAMQDKYLENHKTNNAQPVAPVDNTNA